jgi:hypothetical protein
MHALHSRRHTEFRLAAFVWVAMPTPNKIHVHLDMHVLDQSSGHWTDRDSEELWLADSGWLARWREHHARSYAEVQDALKHAPTLWLSVKPPYLKRDFLATVPIWFTGTTNITSRRFYVIISSRDQAILQGIWLSTWQSPRRHLPHGNMRRKRTTTLHGVDRYQEAVLHNSPYL